MNVQRSKIFLSILFVVLCTICFHYLGFLRGIEDFFWNIVSPSSSYIYDIKLEIEKEKVTKQFRDLDSLKEGYISLYSEVEQVPILETKVTLLEEENIELKEQLAFQKKTKANFVNANVIGKTTEAIGNSLIINVGYLQNVQVGNPVLVGNGILIGKISRTEQDRSIVRIVNDSQSIIAATIMNSDKSLGVVEGGYGISINMNLIPQNEDVSIGDIIVTSGLENNIPRGLVIGKVVATKKEPYKPFQTAVLSPAVTLEKIYIVSVITDI
jgi:rod shape-determining protein MreC